MNPAVDQYLLQGCGRCDLYGTPECKVHLWTNELIRLRAVVLDTQLVEEHKWGVACYTYQGKNVAIMSALKGYVALSFFKGSLLDDKLALLSAPGPNSQAARMFKFTTSSQIAEHETSIRSYVKEAIELEKNGVSVPFKKVTEDDFPSELYDYFLEDPTYESAFRSLTPGRQRGWLLHFNGAKQTATIIRRIEKSAEKVLNGKGWNER
ncbi:YdeI/OmpD-associated family protein [Sanyastnella coralliicola]|uniref:YdeI/OmpD-associated family protein n=1 Tax=Sanyastnella coralliicola TaxID=3069118 RepID=UPI0027B908CB|nr:DUF1801 domain-containing protein [Longitalea sp. SCSIO 12813]